MAAASISLAFSHSSLRSLASIFPLRLPPSIPSDKSFLVLRTPSPRSQVASIRVEASKKSADALLLDRKESGLLRFVKYQGLGNDFIMMCGNGVCCFARFVAELENLHGMKRCCP